MKTEFRFLAVGDKFTFEGVEYVKTNHGRGRICKGSETIHKNFKRRKIVEVNNG